MKVENTIKVYLSENVEGKEISDLVSQNILRATYQFTIIIVLFDSIVCAKFSFCWNSRRRWSWYWPWHI